MNEWMNTTFFFIVPYAAVLCRLVFVTEPMLKATEILLAWPLVWYTFDLILWFTDRKMSWTNNSLSLKLWWLYCLSSNYSIVALYGDMNLSCVNDMIVAKTLSKQRLSLCQFDAWEHISVWFEYKDQSFHWKHASQNVVCKKSDTLTLSLPKWVNTGSEYEHMIWHLPVPSAGAIEPSFRSASPNLKKNETEVWQPNISSQNIGVFKFRIGTDSLP